MQTSAIWLQVFGILFELGGIGVTVHEIWTRSRNLTRFDESQRNKIATATLGVAVQVEAGGMVNDPGHEPTLDERVARLEATVNDLPRRWKRAAEDAAQRAGDAAKRHADDLHTVGGYELDKVKTALRDALAGSGAALAGVVLLVLGVLLQGAGSLVGTWAQLK